MIVGLVCECFFACLICALFEGFVHVSVCFGASFAFMVCALFMFYCDFLFCTFPCLFVCDFALVFWTFGGVCVLACVIMPIFSVRFCLYVQRGNFFLSMCLFLSK